MSDSMPLLYGYWRSTAAYRVRIALNLKALCYEQHSVHLVRDGGEQFSADYQRLNPSSLVPTLVWGEDVVTQSLAICEYLEERCPEQPILPKALAERANVRAIAMDIACDMHPLNNLRVQGYLASNLQADPDAVQRWMHHWMALGFASVEKRLARTAVERPVTVTGHAPGLADICLVAQAYNADRFGFALDVYPRVHSIIGHCRSLPEFQKAEPENQPDAVIA